MKIIQKNAKQRRLHLLAARRWRKDCLVGLTLLWGLTETVSNGWIQTCSPAPSWTQQIRLNEEDGGGVVAYRGSFSQKHSECPRAWINQGYFSLNKKSEISDSFPDRNLNKQMCCV